jgi:hypothetical protein
MYLYRVNKYSNTLPLTFSVGKQLTFIASEIIRTIMTLSPAMSIPNNKEISPKGSVGRTPTTACHETKSDFKLM